MKLRLRKDRRCSRSHTEEEESPDSAFRLKFPVALKDTEEARLEEQGGGGEKPQLGARALRERHQGCGVEPAEPEELKYLPVSQSTSVYWESAVYKALSYPSEPSRWLAQFHGVYCPACVCVCVCV